MATQCKEPHPLSPSPGIFICIKDAEPEHEHVTYDVNGRNYYWLGNVIFITDQNLKRLDPHRGLI